MITPKKSKDSISNRVLRELVNLAGWIKENPDVVLTEGDLQCHIFSRLLEIEGLSVLQKSLDGKFSIALHSEISYFGENNRLGNRVDIAVIDVKDLDTYADQGRRTGGRRRKDYAFDGSQIAIEVKVSRNDSSKTVRKRLCKDLNKLSLLYDLNTDTTFVSFYYDKKNTFEESELKAISSKHPHAEMIYVDRGKLVLEGKIVKGFLNSQKSG